MFDYEKIQRTALSAVGAIILTSMAVGAAVGPARAVETAPIAYAQVLTADQARG
jgi:hypothetical protein